MVDTTGFTDIGRDLAGSLLTGTVAVFFILVMGGIILTAFLLVRHYRQFNIKIRIKSRRSTGTDGQPTYKIIYDKGGFIHKKADKTSWFRLRGERVDLVKPPFEVMQLLAGGANEIEVLKESDEEYYYLLPSVVRKDVIVRGGKTIPMAESEMKIVESDVAYWNQLRKKHNRSLFDMQGALMKILPYAGLLIMFMAVIFLTYIISDHWGTFSSAAQHLAEAAKALRDATTAQTVTSG